MKSVAEKVKKHRKDWEEVFDDTWVLNFVQWCSNVWFFVALLTYIISYFGAGFVNWDACFCNPDHTVRLKKKLNLKNNFFKGPSTTTFSSTWGVI